MSSWITVYCRHVVQLDAEAMRRELGAADLLTLAEALDLPGGEKSAIDAMRPHLSVETLEGGGQTWIEVHWKPEGRPIRVESVTGTTAAEAIAEVLEERLPPVADPGVTRVRDHLRESRQVVMFEMGIDDARQLGATLGEVLAFFVAEAGNGLVWFFDREWCTPEDRGAVICTTDE